MTEYETMMAMLDRAKIPYQLPYHSFFYVIEVAPIGKVEAFSTTMWFDPSGFLTKIGAWE